jgi:hypothetical protein
MGFSERELQNILDDDSKTVSEDIYWSNSEDFSDIVEFRVPLISAAADDLLLHGHYNSKYQKLSFIISKTGSGRIYGLDLGSKHVNRKTKSMERHIIEGIHKHRWKPKIKDGFGYVPDDITAQADEVEKAWEEFCREAKIRHEGKFYHPYQKQKDLFN